MFRYRNWVIAAFNKDEPYNQFLRDQIAGDILAAKEGWPKEQGGVAGQNHRHRLPRQLAPLRLAHPGIPPHDRRHHRQSRQGNSRTDRGLRALPRSQIRPHSRPPIITRSTASSRAPTIRTPAPRSTRTLTGSPRSIPQQAGRTEALRNAAFRPRQPHRGHQGQQDQVRHRRREAQGRNRESGQPAPPHARAIPTSPRPTRSAKASRSTRASWCAANRPPWARKFRAASSRSSAAPKSRPTETGSGRLELADWVTDPKNPLTARVIVNRIWHWHFGQGIVATPDDFGARGEAPTHPELLDYLASRFIESGWSIKKLHRMILLSRAYQAASGNDAEERAQGFQERLPVEVQPPPPRRRRDSRFAARPERQSRPGARRRAAVHAGDDAGGTRSTSPSSPPTRISPPTSAAST